ncbi:MAG: molecular chaperone TorD family protein, partial [Thermodesulfobacteriota bacterium]|nr:molecular chaperone TorD family protein [Thermodesulfobacteriota bacterium]
MNFSADTDSSSDREMFTPGQEQSIQTEQLHQARYIIYKLLSLAYLYPGDIDWNTFICESPGILGEAAGVLSLDITAETATLSRLSNSLDLEQICCEHTMLFINNPNSYSIAPYESVYLEDTIMGRCTRLVREQYEQCGLSVDQKHSYLLPDHIALELDFMAYLIEEKSMQSGSFSLNTQNRFFTDHLGQWMGRFLTDVRSVEVHSYFLSLATVADTFFHYE